MSTHDSCFIQLLYIQMIYLAVYQLKCHPMHETASLVIIAMYLPHSILSFNATFELAAVTVAQAVAKDVAKDNL